MRLELTGRHLTITPTMRRLVLKHLSHIERLLSKSALSVQVVITREKARFHIEINLHARGEHFLHGEAAAADWERALTAATDKIERQAQKLTGKLKALRRGRAVRKPDAAAAPLGATSSGATSSDGASSDGASSDGASSDGASSDNGDAHVRIIRARRYAVKPMSMDDAALEVGEDKNAFLVFRNATNDAVTVLYRRPDGHLGLIEA